MYWREIRDFPVHMEATPAVPSIPDKDPRLFGGVNCTCCPPRRDLGGVGEIAGHRALAVEITPPLDHAVAVQRAGVGFPVGNDILRVICAFAHNPSRTNSQKHQQIFLEVIFYYKIIVVFSYKRG